ncbi:Protein DENND6B [Galemys pyrenaicus]|uniref:Protein DENND6B n=1 Tax=Galemys pyrenaicus TaxID=202257 RepID=A0A8J6AAP5_GALPY|nr:Protein DENND6B [Galemys pyrenaicus]
MHTHGRSVSLQLVYPSDFQLTDKEKSSICYLSFPDSHSGRRPLSGTGLAACQAPPASAAATLARGAPTSASFTLHCAPGPGSCSWPPLGLLSVCGSAGPTPRPQSPSLPPAAWAPGLATDPGAGAGRRSPGRPGKGPLGRVTWQRRPCSPRHKWGPPCDRAWAAALPGCLGDTQFSFRIRRCGGPRHPRHVDDGHYDSGVPALLQREPAHYFGYVHFRQVKDSSVKRGYFQKVGTGAARGGPGPCASSRPLPGPAPASWAVWPCARHMALADSLRGPGVPGPPEGGRPLTALGLQSLVLLSRLPFVRLFQALLSLLAPEYFSRLAPCLEAACNEIDQWPAPTPGQTLSLPVLGVVLQVHVPSRLDQPEPSPPRQQGPENLLPAPVVLSSIHELDLFRCLQPVLTQVHTLWELMLIGEPLVVLAPSPAVSSELVLALTSCLQPLKFCCDYRPYFTVHDSEFKEFTTRTQAPPNVVLGVTNPFFIKTLQHWPHFLRIGEPKMAGDLPKQVKLKKPSRLKTTDPKPGLYTAYTTHLHRDKALLRRLRKGLQKKRPPDAQTALLRRHLLELTRSFLAPLEHYMASLMPLRRSVVPWKVGPVQLEQLEEALPHLPAPGRARLLLWAPGNVGSGLQEGHRPCPGSLALSQMPPQVRPFHQDDFLRDLERAGPQLTCTPKGDWLGLYRRFFKSPHFDGWYLQRRREMARQLEALHLEAICEANVETWMKDKSEVEIVDLVLKLREQLVRAQGQQLPVKESTLQRARLSLETVVRSLPGDLRAILCSS